MQIVFSLFINMLKAVLKIPVQILSLPMSRCV